jgi:hypothetical protein
VPQPAPKTSEEHLKAPTLIGKVVSGQNVVDTIGALPSQGGDGPPTPTVVMSKVTVSRS